MIALQMRLLHRYCKEEIAISLDVLMFLHPMFNKSMPQIKAFISASNSIPPNQTNAKIKEREEKVHQYIKDKMKEAVNKKRAEFQARENQRLGQDALVDRFLQHSNNDPIFSQEQFNVDQIVELEFQRYLKCKPRKVDVNADLIKWWREEGKDYPALREVAASELAAFPSSAILERDFCFGNQVITSANTRTRAWIVSMMMILRINMDYLPAMKDILEFITTTNYRQHIPSHLKTLFPDEEDDPLTTLLNNPD